MAQYNNLIKRISCTVIASFLLCLSIPSFSIRSEASAVLPLDIGSTELLSSLYTMLLTGKFVMDNTRNPFENRPVTSQLNELDAWFEDLNSYRAGLGDDIKSAIISGAIDGQIYLDATARQDFLDALDALYPSGVIPVLQTTNSYPLNEATYTTRCIVNYHTYGDPTVQTITFEFSSTSPYFFSRIPNVGSNWPYCFLFFNTGNTPITVRAINTGSVNDYYVQNETRYMTNSSGDSVNRTVTQFWLKSSYQIDSLSFITQSWLGINYVATNTEIADIITSMLNTGRVELSESLTATKVNTSDQVISTVSTVDENSVVAGPFASSVIPYYKMISILNSIKEGVLKYSDAIRAMRISTVPANSSTAEIADAINNLAEAIPASSTSEVVSDVAGDTIAESRTKTSAVVHIAHSIANAIAEVTGQDLPYPDEDVDVGPNGSPYLHGWYFPDLNGEDPDPGGSSTSTNEDRNRAEDVLSGVSAVSTIASSIYSSASGYNLIVTVGYSLVIFSAIIGAGHFFGALSGRHQDIKQTSLNWKQSDTWDSNNTNWNSKW